MIFSCSKTVKIRKLLSNIQNAPKYVLENLQKVSLEMGELKNAIQQTVVTPAFKKYTAPLEKLYRSLTILDETTLPYTNTVNENS